MFASTQAPKVHAMPNNPKPKRKTAKIDEDIWFKATTIAHASGLDLAQYLSDLLRRPVERDYPKAIEVLRKRDHAPEGD